MEGDEDDILARSRSVLPRWFPDVSPIVDGLLSGQSAAMAHVWSLIAYARLQLRISTATDGFLDLLAHDYFALRFRRRTGESDTLFRERIKAEIVRPRATRASVLAVLREVTGKDAYRFFEPSNPTDTGGWGVAGHMAYSVAGRYGSLSLPHQAFVVPLRPPGQGVPDVQGYRNVAGECAVGGLNQGAIEYATMAMVEGVVTDADVYAAIESVRPAGTVIWTWIASTPPEVFLDQTAFLDSAVMN